jgi:hypothetical protein
MKGCGGEGGDADAGERGSVSIEDEGDDMGDGT